MSQETAYSKRATHSITTKILSFPPACLAITNAFSLSYKVQSSANLKHATQRVKGPARYY